ncbi:MAG: glycosyltransferase family 2 protein [Pseudomonadota bacterium]
MYERVLIFIPTRNTASTIEKTLNLLPERVRKEAQFVVVDNASRDNSVAVAEKLGLPVIRHEQDRGYGGSNKTGFNYALQKNVDLFAILHSDCQYDPTMMDRILAPALQGEVDLVLGSRIMGKKALAGGMPWWKYISNRFLTWMENKALGVHLSEYHTGYRVYSRSLLQKINYKEDSDNWIFDSEILFQICHLKFRIKELPIPTTYEGPISSVSFWDGAIYGLSIFQLIFKYLLHKWGIRKREQFRENTR